MPLFSIMKERRVISNLRLTYPYGVTHTDFPDVEGKTYHECRELIIILTELYYKGYVRAIQEMLKKECFLYGYDKGAREYAKRG